MEINVITLFPEMFASLSHSITGRAQKNEHFQLTPIQLRDFAINKHGQVDDYAYGGEPGMVLRPEPLRDALLSADPELCGETIFLTPQGERFNQKIAEELTEKPKINLVCGHYKGVDERFRQKYVTREISLGDFVLTGGELPAMVLIDAVVRLLPGVLGDFGSGNTDSFTSRLLGWPLFTRPEEFEGEKIPEILKSGHHAKISEWQRQQSLRRTKERRPDLLKNANLSTKDYTFLEEIS